MSKLKVLCFLDNALGRDTEIVLPLVYVFEKYLNADVTVKFIWELLQIKFLKPDVLLLPNVVGHHMYVEAAKYASKSGIKVLALESEGNFRTDGTFDYWGFNKEKKVYQDWLTCWSERTKSYLESILPEQDKKKLVVTGATGFDRFQFQSEVPRKQFLEKNQLPAYEKIIGYAGWAFGKLYGAHREESFYGLRNQKGDENAFEWVEHQRVFVRETLRKVIENNEDTLFILKKHPKENFESDPIEGANEMNELLEYANVRYVKNEILTPDLISVCDIWLGFETTTSLEAWLWDTPTLLINNDPDFPRSELQYGSHLVADYTQLQSCIDEYYVKGSIAQFDSSEMREKRQTLIKDSIGFNDGKNHLRAMVKFKDTLLEKPLKKNFSLNLRHLRLYLLMHLGRHFYYKSLFLRLPKFKKTVYVFENRKMPGFIDRKKECFAALDRFYKEQGIDRKLKNNNWNIFA